MPFGIVQNLVTILQHRNLVLGIDGANQQRLVDILRPDAFHGLVRVVRLHLVAPYHKAVSRRNPQLELLAVAHHVESRRPHDRQQPDHVQHRRLLRQHIATNLFVVGDVALLRPACGSVDIHRRLQRPDFHRLLINAVD